MGDLLQYMPFLIPLVLVQYGLLAYTLYHIFTHKNYKRGNRVTWLVITIALMNFLGPILYFLIGKEDE